jgi:hypothetical protein
MLGYPLRTKIRFPSSGYQEFSRAPSILNVCGDAIVSIIFSAIAGLWVESSAK